MTMRVRAKGSGSFEVGWRVAVEQVDDINWRVLVPLRYTGSQGDTFEIPVGFVTDFASVPRISVWLIPRFGRYTPAAVLHDRLLTHYLPAGEIASNDVDGLFRRAMKELGVPPVRRWLMWTGVRWGAAFSAYRRAGWWRTAPAVLGISVLALPLAVPMLAVAAGILIYGAAEFVATAGKRKGTLST